MMMSQSSRMSKLEAEKAETKQTNEKFHMQQEIDKIHVSNTVEPI